MMVTKAGSAVILAIAWSMSLAPALGMAPQSNAAAPPETTPAQAAIDNGYAEIKASNPQKAIDSVEPVIARIDRDLVAEKRRVYCGMSTTEALLYMAQAAAAKHDAVAIAPDLCDALFIKAFALVDLDRTEDAQTIFKRLIDLAPSHSQFFSELGNTYRVQKNWAAGLEAYENAENTAFLAEKSDLPTRQCIALRGQGYILVELGKLDDAEKAYRKCLKLIPSEPKSLGELGYIKEQRNK